MSKLPPIKKDIERFLSSEEGKISQKSIIDLGIGVVVLSLLAGRLTPSDVAAFTDHCSCHVNCHTNCHSSCGCHTNCNCHANCEGWCHSSCTCHGNCIGSCHSSCE